MAVGNWDEIRTAYQVARMGTVSGAAEALGVHHSTVIRHVDALEDRLGVKLFQRHARGYTPTEAGRDLLQVAQATDDQFSQFASRVRGRGEAVTGELILTTLAGLVPMLMPAVAAFQAMHPGLIVRLLTGERLFRLEYGEAHVAIRAGSPPEEPDNVVQPFHREVGAFFAARSYAEAHGLPADESEIAGHAFVSYDSETPRAPFDRWLRAHVPPEQIVFRSTEQSINMAAVRAGAGIGYMPLCSGRGDPDLVEVWGPREDWTAPLWLVTHVDLHRTMKVQAFTAFLKEKVKEWPVC
ncbi:LysR family transcriptional regulator [Psychromarinibacter sp. C21-152]|uniref:LysR family transcriptional regulator n=1 Tax=Psychromarinibacter sediminicola TaxID=3033385 RepID=A0AAE3NW74_9RHOB|nr:LysR family transcriptional regulator [Psychromarinibacter sediminicola]MDF0601772.1 LysR family transcriptional regulator [Psychromarinibacter sediminicola]